MKKFKHFNASSVKEAVSVLREYGEKARIIAGGTDLLGEMKDDILPDYPELIVNIKSIPGMDYIRLRNGKLRIGALTRLEDVASSSTIKEKFPALAEAAHRTASPHIREMGTIAGNICQNNRCWYYWVPDNRFYCLRKGGKICFALTGDGRYHSIFGATRIIRTPCRAGCPDNIEIPDYLNKIREGDLAEAALILLQNNPLPAITGRVCPHFCEQDCNRDYHDEPVSIRSVERFAGDYVLEHAPDFYRSPEEKSGKKVAIIGSGPAGLSAAYYLRKAGHDVSLYEDSSEPGGLLARGIPPYRLPGDVVRKQIDALRNMGINIFTGNRIDSSRFSGLVQSYDAVFIAAGAWKERAAGIPGEQYLIPGMEFLEKCKAGKPEVPGKKVGIIGGGNVAIDVARSLLRLGARPVVIYRRTRSEMPALKDEIEKALEEGVAFEFLTLPLEAIRKDGRTVLKCTRMELGPADESGRPRPIPVKGSEFYAEYDAVVKAVGELPDTSFLPSEFVTRAGNLKIDKEKYSLGKGVFAGGDFVTGPATVVEAIAAGRKAAARINRYLGGREPEQGNNQGCDGIAPLKFNSAYLQQTRRSRPPELTVSDRIKGINIEETGPLDEPGVQTEANRCFNCGCVAVNSSDIAPALIALGAKIKTSRRMIDSEEFFRAGVDKTTILDDDEIVLEIQLPEPEEGSRSGFIKLAIRKSIDFPIVNCAASVAIRQGVVNSARICLNSVYNLPYRVKKAEEYLIGKPLNETTAAAAADAGVQDAFPVVNNRYKIQIARALIKRILLNCSGSSTGN